MRFIARTRPLLLMLGACLLAGCGSTAAGGTSHSSTGPISGGLAQGSAAGQGSSADKSVATGNQAQQANSASVILQAQGDRKIVQNASMGVQIKSGTFWDS